MDPAIKRMPLQRGVSGSGSGSGSGSLRLAARCLARSAILGPSGSNTEPGRAGPSSVKSIGGSLAAVRCVSIDERPIPARFQRSAVPWVPTDGRASRALERYLLSHGFQTGRRDDACASSGPAPNSGSSGEIGGSGSMLSVRLLLRLRRPVALRLGRCLARVLPRGAARNPGLAPCSSAERAAG